jgi:hypothetical protein
LDAGDRNAEEAVAQSERESATFPAGVGSSILWLAQHCGNVLHLPGSKDNKTLRKAAEHERRRLNKWHETGYLGLHRVISMSTPAAK